VFGVAMLDPGVYHVVWDRSVDTCGYLATVVSAEAGQISALNTLGEPNAVQVRTWDPAGTTTTPMAFTVSVICPQPPTPLP
jgi:hypothetical protein